MRETASLAYEFFRWLRAKYLRLAYHRFLVCRRVNNGRIAFLASLEPTPTLEQRTPLPYRTTPRQNIVRKTVVMMPSTHIAVEAKSCPLNNEDIICSSLISNH